MAVAFRPDNLEAALRIRKQENATVFAGGTDLMVKNRVWSGTIPQFNQPLLFIGHLPELRQIIFQDEMLVIGAACTFSQILRAKGIPDYIRYPILEIASPAIRNMATIGGNICNSSPAADILPMLYALDATLVLQTEGGTYEMAVSDFITGPGRKNLMPDQILAAVRIPLGRAWSCLYRKVGTRKANSISKVSFYAVSDMQGRNLIDVRIALGAVAPVVVRCREAENLLTGLTADEIPNVISYVTEKYSKLVNPIDDVRSSKNYRQYTAEHLLKYYLSEVLST